MDAPCKIQGSIHVFRLVNNMCPGKWVHIKNSVVLFFSYTIHIWIVCVVCIVCCERDIYIHHVYTYELGGNPS